MKGSENTNAIDPHRVPLFLGYFDSNMYTGAAQKIYMCIEEMFSGLLIKVKAVVEWWDDQTY